MLTAPNWFARGALGRAMTHLDIWAQVHLPYPVLTLLLAGFAATAATVWFRRQLTHGPNAHDLGQDLRSRKR
jgi:hypothetical protein